MRTNPRYFESAQILKIITEKTAQRALSTRTALFNHVRDDGMSKRQSKTTISPVEFIESVIKHD